MANRSRTDWLRWRLRWVFEARSAGAAVMHTLAAQFGVLGVNLATGLIIARELAPKGRGEQAAMTLWPAVLASLLSFGLPVALRYYAARDRARSSELLGVALIYAALLGFVATFAGIVFVPHWLSHYNVHVIRFTQWLMLLSPPFLVARILQSFLEARGDFRQSNFILYMPPAGTLVTLLALIGFHRLNPYTSSLAYVIPTVLLTVWRLIALRRFIRFRLPDFAEATRRLFTYGFGAYGINILNTFAAQIDQALVVKFLSPADLGAYTVALTIGRLPSTIAQALVVVLLPRATALEFDAALTLVARAARVNLVGTAVASTVLALVVPTALPFLYGHAFSISVGVAEILLLQVVISSTTSVLAQSFLATGRPVFLTILQALGLGTAVPFLLMLIPRFGLIGAALALLASTLVRLAFMMVSYPLFLKRPPPSLVLRTDDIRFVRESLRGGRRAPLPQEAEI
ncbi:MAG: polysaccharide biosynthesis C-terminal domain-containing protein [Candidatus Eremiobacteraeota bacterium]|nr:polysaccharide biosynthesis C-terminal domain-containing protein [Candidatus Eremiobacteraeota bacterium]